MILKPYSQTMQEQARNGFGVPKWTSTDSDLLKSAVKQVNHKNKNGGNGMYGVDQNWSGGLNIPRPEKKSILSNLLN